MQKFFKNKYLIIYLGFLFLVIFIPTIIFAATSNDYYQSPSTTTVNVISQRGPSTVINRSDKKVFVPNRTSPEWDSFAKNAPPYVSVSTCPDGQCGEGETSDNCPLDCGGLSGAYCGDGICSNSPTIVYHNPPLKVDVWKQVCQEHARGWIWVPVVNFVVLAIGQMNYQTCDNVKETVEFYWTSEPKGEVYSVLYPNIQKACRDDCAPPAGSGCGSCGYDADGKLCPNYCSNRGYNLINCAYQASYTETPTNYQPNLVINNNSIKKYLTASEALAYAATPMTTNPGYTYTVPASYHCDFGGDTSNLCPAGSYCPLTGGLKGSTALTNWATLAPYFYSINLLQVSCNAGYFCPIASYFPRICPKNTYSTGAASKCTACPVGTESVEGSPSLDFCQPKFQANDGVCNGNGVTGVENPANSPYDCPDATQIAGTLWKGDHRCTGLEDMNNSPVDCKCGDHICNNNESYLSCMQDCFGFDGICGTKISKYNPLTSTYTSTVYSEKNTANSYGNPIPSDCTGISDADTCGDGTCGTKEGYSPSLGKIICPLDCHCGDGYCVTGEFYSPTNVAGSCNLDCKCGDSICNNDETATSCIGDCHCGNGRCESQYGENSLTCDDDCYCGDNVCSVGETATSCAKDCSPCNYNSVCDAGEVKAYCADCGRLLAQ